MPVVPLVTPDGEQIRKFREDLDLSREELAAIMSQNRHRHPKTLQRIECGQDRTASTVLIADIARALGRDVGELIKAEAA